MSKGRILVVDDEEVILEMLREFLTSGGYEVFCASNCDEAWEIMQKKNVEVVLLDILMPGKKGTWLLDKIQRERPYTMVIMLTAVSDINMAIQCLKSGAYDYIVKPFLLEEIPIVIERAREKRRLKIKEEAWKRELQAKVAEQKIKLRELFLGSLSALVKVIEAKDEYTLGHSKMVASISYEISRHLRLPQKDRKKILLAGELHDIGKVGVRDDILRKPGPLEPEEFEHIKRHPVLSYEIVSYVIKDNFVLSSIRHHHERFNGEGYPDRLKGEEIPLGARILAVADAFDAMTSDRPYRKAFMWRIAREKIRESAGIQFDPEIVEVFLSIPVHKILPEELV